MKRVDHNIEKCSAVFSKILPACLGGEKTTPAALGTRKPGHIATAVDGAGRRVWDNGALRIFVVKLHKDIEEAVVAAVRRCSTASKTMYLDVCCEVAEIERLSDVQPGEASDVLPPIARVGLYGGTALLETLYELVYKVLKQSKLNMSDGCTMMLLAVLSLGAR